MSDTPAAVAESAATATPAPALEAPALISLTSEQLRTRLDETRSSASSKVLKDLGFKSEDDAKAFVKLAKDLQQSQLTEQEKLNARLKELEPKAERLDAVTKRFASLVEEQFNALPEATRNAVDGVAQGDAEKRLELISMMRASGLLTAQPAAPVTTPPATTSEAVKAPKPTPPKSKYDEWQTLEADPTRRMLSSTFYNIHRAEIERSRPA